MKQRSLFVILIVFIFTVTLLSVRGGAVQARGLDQPQSPTACSPSIVVTNANDSGAGSLRQAIDDLCTGGTITFNGDYTIILDSTLIIHKNVMINGVGHNIVLNGNNVVQVILVAMDGTLNLQNLTVWQGSSSLGGGGGIKTSGDLNVTNVYFANNTTTGEGGVIYVTPVSSPPIITVTNSTFYQNSASEGGAISNYGSIATVTGSTFWGNSASDRGGAIGQDAWGSTVVTNSTFFLNTAAGTYGGAQSTVSIAT
jgi:predicted outer membrane repeat protein